MSTNERNIGIDLLRILAMLFVVMLHVCSHGGALAAAHGANAYAVNIVRSFAICAVNVFVMISGYCMVESRFKSKRIISLWLEAFFYSILISLTFLLWVNPSLVTTNALARSFTPILSNKWWFLTQYFILFFFMPILNKGLMTLNERQCGLVIACAFGVTFAVMLSGDLFKIDRGYSFGWFVLLYIVGGATKRLAPRIKGRAIHWLAIYAAMALLTFVCFGAAGHFADTSSFAKDLSSRILIYSSPFVLASALALLICGSKIRFQNGIACKVIGFCSSSAFAVYLISDHVWVRNEFIKGSFDFVAGFAPPLTACAIVGIAVAVFVACMLVDKVRMGLFKLCRIDALALKLGNAIDDHIVYRDSAQ